MKYSIKYIISFRPVNIIMLKKLKKNNYIKSKLYRLIALLNILKKTLKTIIVKYLNNYIKNNNLFSLK